MDPSMTTYLFVYGTLRRRSRHSMARRLEAAARFVGAAKIPARLYDLGRYPGLQEPLAQNDWVQGDIYDLGEHAAQTLAEMDAYENVESPRPAFFDRQMATAVLAGGDVPVWVYWFRGDVREEQRILSGSYETNCDPG
jgi:gamma-glutamylcyclotransferase (GGCT)/AIG2-like uncharacterized protein YtfP